MMKPCQTLLSQNTQHRGRENKEQKEMTQNWARKQKPTIRGKKEEGEKVKYLIRQSKDAC